MWGGEVNANFPKILGHNIDHGGLGISDPRLSADISHSTYKTLLEQGKYWWYFSETAKSPFIAYFTTQKAAALWKFEAEGLALKSVGGSHYLGAHLGTR